MDDTPAIVFIRIGNSLIDEFILQDNLENKKKINKKCEVPKPPKYYHSLLQKKFLEIKNK